MGRILGGIGFVVLCVLAYLTIVKSDYSDKKKDK
jgi:hypothetical protein